MNDTKQQIIDKLTEQNESEIKDNRIHVAVVEFLKTQIGKKVDGWFERKAKKYFLEKHGWNVRIGNAAVTLVYFYVWGGDSGYSENNPIRLHLGYNSVIVDIESFEKHQSCTGRAALERIENRNKTLANDSYLSELAAAIDIFKTAKESLKELIGSPAPRETVYYIARDLSGLEKG